MRKVIGYQLCQKLDTGKDTVITFFATTFKNNADALAKRYSGKGYFVRPVVKNKVLA